MTRVSGFRCATASSCSTKRERRPQPPDALAPFSGEMVQVTGASALSDERTLQYLVIESSTALAALAAVAPGAVIEKCKLAEASRFGMASTRCASMRM